MKPLQWNSALATGIDVVDEQHQRLLGIFNAAATAQKEGTSSEQAAGLLESLFDYTRYHFREEAQLMRTWDLDAEFRATHLKAHERFVAFLEQVRGQATGHPPEFTTDLLAFLAQWLLHHIMGLDAEMARQIRVRRGEEGAAATETTPCEDPTRRYLFDVMGKLTDTLGKRTFDLLDQRQKLLDLQDLYRALLRSADLLIHSQSAAETLTNLCSMLTQDTPFHTAWICRKDTSQAYKILARSGSSAPQVDEATLHLAAGPELSLVARVLSEQQAVICNDTTADADLRAWHDRSVVPEWASVMAAPVVRGARAWAVLFFVSAQRGAFDEDTITLCTRIAELLGHGLDEFDRKSALERLQNMDSHRARTDALTGLPNRLALHEHLPGALARAQRRNGMVAVGMIDLDNFKPVNDQFGHAAGDVLLQKIAHELLLQVRRGDFLARLGGDEFVVVFEDLDADHYGDQLRIAIGRLHAAVGKTFDLGGGRRAQVGMSVGLALYPNDATDPDTLLQCADDAMYATKNRATGALDWDWTGQERRRKP